MPRFYVGQKVKLLHNIYFNGYDMWQEGDVCEVTALETNRHQVLVYYVLFNLRTRQSGVIYNESALDAFEDEPDLPEPKKTKYDADM